MDDPGLKSEPPVFGEQTPLVEVLLATYNGERFVRQQIDSILAQAYEPLRILARDDGSRDGTRAILEEYAQRYPEQFVLLPPSAPSGGAKWNFIRLMEAATAEYICCSDQDDVWLPEKIALSMGAMRVLEQSHGRDLPLLIFTDLKVVDQDLKEKAGSFWAYQRIDPNGIHSFPRLITQNVVTGCTTLMNARLCRMAVRMPAESFMHDWWLALVAVGFGAARFISTPTVLYRQHDKNVVGAVERQASNLVPRFRYHEKRREQWLRSEKNAEGMLRVYGTELPAEKRRILEQYVLCETNPNRLVRVWTLVWNGFFLKGLRPNLAIAWYLWDMKAAQRQS